MKISKKRLNEIIKEETAKLIKEQADSIAKRYQDDPSIAYMLSPEEIHDLMSEFGEDDILVDALMKVEGQSIDARAEQLGVDPDAFDYERQRDADNDKSIPVADLFNAPGSPRRKRMFADY